MSSLDHELDVYRSPRSRAALLAALLCLAPVLLGACLEAPEIVGPRADHAAIAERLEALIRREMDGKGIPALSIALVDGGETVWARGFGYADPERGVRAGAETIYRAGSVSKLFTDMALMQAVEMGRVDLDAPVSDYLGGFRPRNPYRKPITLRQLMCHRSGLVREPPAGSYFDPTEPSLEATVASLNDTSLVYEPESRQKYSNAGISLVGYALERISGRPFAQYVKEALLEPMGMARSSFERDGAVRARLAKAYMWTYDGRLFEAPTFSLGTSPAGNLYSTVTDLARFLNVIFDGGRVREGTRILEPETLEAMWKPQFAGEGATRGFGLGFHVSDFEGHRRVGHNGAVYGFSTALAALPDAKLGVVAVSSLDVTNAVVSRIANEALRAMLARRRGEPLPELQETRPIDPRRARDLAGRYSSGEETIEILRRGERLYLALRDKLLELRERNGELITDGRLSFGTRLGVADGELRLGGRTYRKVALRKPPPAPERWRGLIGEYGWDHNVLYVLEKDGRLHALIEWFDSYPLEEVSENVFNFPDHGLYHGEQLVFERDATGMATRVVAASVAFPRREVGTPAGATFRIEPLKPVAELRRAALEASPPQEAGQRREPELVDLAQLDPTIKLDVRYATTDNFLGAVFYEEPRAFLERSAADALLRAHRKLAAEGYGLLIHDAYRPWYITKMFWDATPETLRHFVADPSEGSRHNRGSAVDLTLCELGSGSPAPMVAGYDEFSPRSYPYYPGGTSLERWHRKLLREVMESEGFAVYEYEWWHFDYKDWERYPILNRTFAEIDDGH